MIKRPTEKQTAARMRNWGIRSLRAFYAQCHILAPERREKVCAIIDEELAARGALITKQHTEKLFDEWSNLK
jgi:hypothetical protein